MKIECAAMSFVALKVLMSVMKAFNQIMKCCARCLIQKSIWLKIGPASFCFLGHNVKSLIRKHFVISHSYTSCDDGFFFSTCMRTQHQI